MQALGTFARLTYCDEAAWGVTPASDPVMRHLKALVPGESLGAAMEELISRAINGNRAIEDVRRGNLSVKGGLPFEMAPLGLAALFKHVLGDADTEASQSPYTHILRRGALPAGMSVEKGFTDLDKYFVFNGVKVNSAQLTIPATGLVTGSLDVIGRDYELNNTSLGEPIAVAHTPFVAYEATFQEGAAPVTVLNTNLTIGNNLEAVSAAGNRPIVALNDGKGDATGELTLMFANTTVFDKWAQEAFSKFKITLTQAANGSAELYFPSILYVGDPVPKIATDQGLVAVFKFRARYDDAEATDIRATFTNATEDEI